MLILFLPPPYTVVNLNSQANRHCEREKSHGGERRRKKKKEEEKSPEKNHFTVTGIWTHGLCLQSQACYPLGHGALPNKNTNLKNIRPEPI